MGVSVGRIARCIDHVTSGMACTGSAVPSTAVICILILCIPLCDVVSPNFDQRSTLQHSEPQKMSLLTNACPGDTVRTVKQKCHQAFG